MVSAVIPLAVVIVGLIRRDPFVLLVLVVAALVATWFYQFRDPNVQP